MPLNPTTPVVSDVESLVILIRTCHIEGETSVGSIERASIYEVSSKAGGKDGARGIDTNTNPSAQGLQSSTHVGHETRRTD